MTATCLKRRFLVDLRSTANGAVVHSVERLICIQEVRGSNPLGSTKQKGNDITLICLEILPQFFAISILASVAGNLITFIILQNRVIFV
jgi:hypothetical protein